MFIVDFIEEGKMQISSNIHDIEFDKHHLLEMEKCLEFILQGIH